MDAGRGRGRVSGLNYQAVWARNKALHASSIGNHAKSVQTKHLNPNAKAWSPVMDSAPEEDRCLFVTFSNGHPITEAEIVRFFTL